MGGVLLFVVLLVWLFSSSDENESPEGKGRQVFTSSDWKPRYKPFDKNPRGTYIFHKLVQTHIKKKDMYMVERYRHLDSILRKDNQRRTYFFVGNKFALKNSEIDSIMSKVQNGSDIFFSFEQITDNVLDRFFDTVYFRADYAEEELVYTSRAKYKLMEFFQKDTVATYWNAFGQIVPKGDAKALSTFMEMENFLVIKMGKGKVFLHTNPNMFYNYQLKRNDGFRHARFVIDQLSDKKDVVLLELGRLPDDFDEDEEKEDGDGSGKKGGKQDNSLLRWLLERPMLRNALLLLIGGLLLYVIFRSQRKRPAVPYYPKKKNMTLAFTETITSIYYAKQNHYGMLQVQRRNFYATILKHYFVDLNRREGDREIRILAEKSNKPFDEIKSLVNKFETKEVSRVNDQTIIEMAKLQQSFYKHMGIITDKIDQRIKKREMVFRRGLLLPTLLILFGVIGILCGFYFLVNSIGPGIALWPVGAALVTLGVLRMVNPYLKVTEKHLITYSEFGRKRTYLREEVISTKSTKSGVVIQLRNNKKIVINYWDMSRFDREQFDRFISKVHTLDL
ncbi:MAG: hypothetical protein NXI10_00990 [bacterium]|nr:hypothetical protein [bacterium]